MKTISIDNGAGADRFQRVRLSRRLLNTILAVDASESGAVIGLEGRWGSGKTHVLRPLETIAEEIDEDRRPILVRFNPWMMSGARDIVNALLVQLAAALSSSEAPPERRRFRRFFAKPVASAGAVLAENMLHYASLLAVLKSASLAADFVSPGSGLVLGGVGGAADAAASAAGSLSKALKRFGGSPAGLSLPEIRGRLLRGLKAQRRRIVVLVDDLDRLPPAELGEMFRAVKAVADFPNVVYVLSYDPEIVSGALKSSLGIHDGRAYLEKIVNLPIVVPEIPAGTFHEFAIARLRGAVTNSELHADEGEDLEKAYTLAAAMLATPRDVERLRTRMQYLSMSMVGQLNFADVLLLEAIHQCARPVAEWVVSNPGILTTYRLHRYDEHLQARHVFQGDGIDRPRTGEGAEEDLKAELRSWWDLVPDDRKAQRSAIGEVLQFLFDKLKKTSYTIKRSSYRRCQDFRYLYRWQCRGESHDLFSADDIALLLASPQSLTETRAFRDVDAFLDFCAHLADLNPSDIPSVDALDLTDTMVQAERKFGAYVVADWGVVTGPLHTLLEILQRCDRDEVGAALVRLVNSASVWLSGNVLRRVVDDVRQVGNNSRSEDGAILAPEGSVPRLVGMWFEKAVSAIRSRDWQVEDRFQSEHYLLSMALWIGCDLAVIRDLMREVLFERRIPLVQCFSDLSDKQDYRRMSPTWQILPPEEELLALMEADREFSARHAGFVWQVRQRARPPARAEDSSAPQSLPSGHVPTSEL